MKRKNNLFNKITDINNIIKAHFAARDGKAHNHQVQMVNADLYLYANKIRDMLLTNTWVPKEVVKKERFASGKKRVTVNVEYYPDRIIHHAIMQIIEPIFKTTYIKDTYQSIKGRGLHKGAKRVRSWLKYEEDTKFCLQVDIEKFYPSMKHSVIKKYYRKKIKCKPTLQLLDILIDSDDGLPIGFYSSQSLGNFIVSYLDHYIKSLGAKFYIRYADDIVILHKSKEHLHFLRMKMQKFMKEKLELKMKGNYQVFPIAKRGLDFLGYVFFRKYTLIRKSIATRMKRAFRKKPIRELGDISRIMSYLGWAKYANSYNLQRVLIPLVKNKIERLAIKLKIKNALRSVYLLDKPHMKQLTLF